MSSPFIFCLRNLPSAVNFGKQFGHHVILRLSSTAQNAKDVRRIKVSSIDRGLLSDSFFLCHRHLLCIGSGNINFGQTGFPGNILACICGKTMLNHTDLKATKAAKRPTWETWSSPHNLRRKQINQDFSLDCIFRILDQRIFRGLLGNRVVLRWIEPPMGKLHWLSRISLTSDAKRGPCLLIEVMKPIANGPWRHEIIQKRLEALLYEMTQIFILIYNCDPVPFLWSKHQTVGRGHGWLRILHKVEQEANRTLKGPLGPWHLRQSPEASAMSLQDFRNRTKGLGLNDGSWSR